MFKKIVPFLIIPLFTVLFLLLVFFFPDVIVGILLCILISTILYALSYLSLLMFGKKILGEEKYNRLIEKMEIF